MLTVVYFLTASITTFDKRLIQAKRRGDLPPDHPDLPSWVVGVYWLQWLTLLILFIINWKYALYLFGIKFVLSVLPILEIIGNFLMGFFKSHK